MSAKETTKKRGSEVRIGIPLRAFLRFSRQIDEQLEGLETQVFAAVPQLANRRAERRSTKLR